MDTILLTTSAFPSSNVFRLIFPLIVREFPIINKIIDVSSLENFCISILSAILSALIFIGLLWFIFSIIYNLIFKSSKSDIKNK